MKKLKQILFVLILICMSTMVGSLIVIWGTSSNSMQINALITFSIASVIGLIACNKYDYIKRNYKCPSSKGFIEL